MSIFQKRNNKWMINWFGRRFYGPYLYFRRPIKQAFKILINETWHSIMGTKYMIHGGQETRFNRFNRRRKFIEHEKKLSKPEYHMCRRKKQGKNILKWRAEENRLCKDICQKEINYILRKINGTSK